MAAQPCRPDLFSRMPHGVPISFFFLFSYADDPPQGWSTDWVVPAPASNTAEALVRLVKQHTPPAFLAFSGVSPDDFERFYKLFEGCGRVTYFGEGGLLLVKMPGREHEVALTTLTDYIRYQTIEMGLHTTCIRSGATRFDGANGAAKEGDDGFLPKRLGRSVPTIVIEVAYSQNLVQAHFAKD